MAKINAVLQAEADAQRVESTSGTLAPEDLHVWIRANVRRTLSSRPEELAETLFGIPFGVFVPTADLTRVRLGSAETRVVAGNKRKQATAGSNQSAKLQEIQNVENLFGSGLYYTQSRSRSELELCSHLDFFSPKALQGQKVNVQLWFNFGSRRPRNSACSAALCNSMPDIL